MKENKRAIQLESVAKRDLDRQIYRETHPSKRARKFVIVGYKK